MALTYNKYQMLTSLGNHSKVLNKTNAIHTVKQSNLTYYYAKSEITDKNCLPKYMKLIQCSATRLDRTKVDLSSVTTIKRPLTVILPWTLAKDKHLEKYRQLWLRRDFDVLTVRTSLKDVLLPPIGSHVIASDLINVLNQFNFQYKEIIIHAFSIGTYHFGETLIKLGSIDQNKSISESIKGLVFDSTGFPTDNPSHDLSKAVTSNPILQPIIETLFRVYFKLSYNISIKNYFRSSEKLNSQLSPGLLLYSEKDILSRIESNKRLAQKWKEKGVLVQTKCWKNSNHVLHYRNHQQEYEQELDTFLKKLKLNNR